MPTITLLQLSRRRKDRVHVHLDDEYAFSLPLELAVPLRKGQELSAGEVAELQADAHYRHVLDRALHFLSYRPRSRAEVARYLAGKEVPAPMAERVLDHLTEVGFIDDAAFARWWVENRLRHRPRGPWALRQELAVRGVNEAVLADSLAAIDEQALAATLALAEAPRYRGLDGATFKRRLAGFLQRRGFGADAVWAATNAAWDHLEQAADAVSEDQPQPSQT